MSTLEIKRELHNYIEIGNDEFVENLYKMVKDQLCQMETERMIEEGEEDIRAGRTYSLAEAKKIIDNWEEQKK